VSSVDVSALGVSLPPWAGRLAAFALKAQARIGRKAVEISLLLCDDAVIRRLNRRYRRKDRATDVLSFRQADGAEAAPGTGARIAGDVVISLETMKRNARTGDRSEEEEIKRLLVHGLLHLAGMDHGAGEDPDAPEGEMLVRQERILRRLSKERIL
jgi:probable rRNA maturation factor